MLKALLKKQFLELHTFYFIDKKTGKKRSKGGIVGFVILFAFIFLSLAVAFAGMEFLFAASLLPSGLDWLYFSTIGILAIFFGTFGSVFNTYAGLYHAKDNELLLSMPITPSKILLVRMIGVYLMSLLYSAIVFVPGVIVYWIVKTPTFTTVLFPVLLVFIIALFVHVLTSALGWVVALIASKLKNKAFVTVILSLALLAVYYVCYFKMNSILTYIVDHAENLGVVIRGYLFPIYHLGLAASGNALSMLIFSLIVGALFALTYFILSKSFVKIVTAKRGEEKKEYKEGKTKASGVGASLLGKELKRFTASPTYMLNCGLGLIIMIAASVFAVIKADAVRDMISQLDNSIPALSAFIPVAAAAAIMLVSSMNAISAPSVSLEGNTLWILQSLPVEAKKVMQAKQRLHIILNALPVFFSAVVLGIVIKADVPTVVSITLLSFAFTCLSASFGLMLGIKKPTLEWTNETIPIKQSVPVTIALFGGWLLAVVFAGPYFFLCAFVPAWIYILFWALIIAVASVLISKWNMTKGAEIFSKL